jgi:PAS domain S-box-containing protein
MQRQIKRFQLTSNQTFFIAAVILPVVHFCLASFARYLSFQNGATAIWPSAGVFLAAVLMLGWRITPVLGLSDFLVSFFLFDQSLLTSFAISLIDLIDPIVISLLIWRFIKPYKLLACVQNVFKFLVLILPSPVISTTLGVTVLCLSGDTSWTVYNEIWWNWIMGSLTAFLVVAPALIVWSHFAEQQSQYEIGRVFEFAILLFLVVVITWEAFHRWHDLEYLIIPLLIWSTFRLGQRESTLLLIAVATIAVWATADGFGTFADRSISESLLLLQAFICVVAITILVLCAAISENRRVAAKLRKANEELEQRVEDRTFELKYTNEQLQHKIAERELAEAERIQLLIQEQALRAEAEAARNQIINTLESITDGFFALDSYWHFTYLNRQAERLLQRSQTELIGKNIWHEFPEMVDLSFYQQYYQAVKTQQSVTFEAFYPMLKTWFAVHAYPTTEGLSVYFQDINQRKKVEERLVWISKAVESTSDGISVTDLSGQLIYHNGAFLNLYGYSVDALNTAGGPKILFTKPEIYEQMSEAIQSGQSWSGEVELKTNDQRIVPTLLRADCVMDEIGDQLGLIGVYTDITERKQVEEEMRFLQTMTQAIFESEDFQSALGIALQKVGEATGWDFGEAWIPRADNSVLECSSAWYCRTAGLEKFRAISQQMTFAPGIGLPGRVWVSRQPEWRSNVSAESNQIYLRAQVAREIGLKSGLGIPIAVNGAVMAVLVFYMFESRDEDARLVELISASTQLGLIIQRKRAEEEVRQALEKEKELSELKSRFVSMISHEFRTPLSVISFSSGLLENYSYRWSEEKRFQHFQRIQTAVKQMTRLLEDVLFIGKEAAGKLELKPEPIDLEKFCCELVEEMQLSAGPQHCIIFCKQGEPSEARMDEKLLRQIFGNLLTNAIKYSPEGGTIYFRLLYRSEEVVFQVQDQGIGIPPEDQQRLFDSFHRASNVGTISGTGLGLAIVKQSLDIHQGKISVASEVGSGTTFTVTLPLSQPSAPS